MEKAVGRPFVTCQAPRKIGTPEVRFVREGQHPVDNVLVYFVYDGEEISPEVQAKSCANVLIDENGTVVVSANQTSAFYEEFISKANPDPNPSSHNLLFSVDFNVEQNLLTIDGTFPPFYQKDVQSLPSPLSAVTIPETERERSERKRQAKIEIEHLLQAFQHGNHELKKSVDELHQQGLVRVQEGELKAGKRWSKDDLMMEIPSRIKNLPAEITDQPDRLRCSDSPPTHPKAINMTQEQEDPNLAPLHRSEPFGFEPSQLRNTSSTPSSSSLASTYPALGSGEDPGSGIFSWIFSSFSNKPQLVSTNDHPNGNNLHHNGQMVSESATTSSCSSDPIQVKSLKRGRGRSMSARVSKKPTDTPRMREGGNESGEASPRLDALQEDELGRAFEEKLKELSLNDPVEEFWKKESQTASSFLVPYRTRSPIDQIESVIALSRSPSPVTVSDISNLMNEPLSSPFATPLMGSPAPSSPHVKRVAPGIFSPPPSGPSSRPSSRASSRATSPDRRALETSTL